MKYLALELSLMSLEVSRLDEGFGRNFVFTMVINCRMAFCFIAIELKKPYNES